MASFVLHLQGAAQYDRIEGVTCFVGEDPSGSFGILPGHGRFMTALVFGLARFRLQTGTWQYLALPGALLYFLDNELFICTRRYFRDADYEHISQVLIARLTREETALREMRRNLEQLEQEMLRRLWKIKPGARR
jgi:F-type H+-transporting ATPase subunit epsilon